ncbi:MAG: hypothetical protein ACI90V_010882, partial [Bacillariaceae sp.]
LLTSSFVIITLKVGGSISQPQQKQSVESALIIL